MQGQKPPTASEQRRLTAIHELWCLPCAMNGWDGVPTTVQHVVEGRVRLGHEYSWPGCIWHHLGNPGKFTAAEAVARFGPCVERQLRRFEQAFAQERILVAITDAMLVRKAQMEAGGRYMTPEDYGEWVRQEAVHRLGRSVAIGR